ncbi:PAS domain S-box protein [Aggregicoccus sp. 17bor-14]|uniref:sensor histidine kinase n=1 Tax=Myxococcaceae TaxID=31 RepID=UPI00129C745F|nr:MULTISPECIES: PAS domain-containing sensor histidine kinase [Myxococcaceae]MBF5042918.1 PAS domain-containing sensor histidine kinase [Simulacricoccus sp. 17bor-14]MRI88685.1 PAS domain S-box protein [Aggregicoccus sp. 17bor-14]
MADPSPRLLCVSDDAALLAQLRAVLQPAGYAVDAAAPGPAVQALLGEAALLLLDLRGGAPGAARALLTAPGAPPRLALVDAAALEAPPPAGADAVLAPPLGAGPLLALVRTLVRLGSAEAKARVLASELTRRAQLLDAALASAADAFSIYDRDRRLVFLNPSAAGRPGVPLDALLGRTARELPLDPASLESFARDLDQAYESRAVLRGRARLPRPGSALGPRYTEYLMSPALGEDGQVEAMIVISRDVTEQRRAEEFREQFIGILGHDLRNPLNAVSMTVQQLGRLGAFAAYPQHEARLTQATGRMQRMIRQLLDFARARLGGQLPLVRAPVDLCTLVRGAVEELQASHPGRSVQLECCAHARGQWDRDRLEQVVGNLLANALKYSPAQGEVRVTVEADEDADGESDGEVRLLVHNGGEPIPAELLPHLFEPFRRAGGEDAAEGAYAAGLGLGLYISDQVVRAHGGRIEVRSSRDAGTTVTAHLPRG